MDWLSTIDSILNSPLAGTIAGKKTPAPVTPTPVITVQNPIEKPTPWGLIAGGVAGVVLILVLLLKKK